MWGKGWEEYTEAREGGRKEQCWQEYDGWTLGTRGHSSGKRMESMFKSRNMQNPFLKVGARMPAVHTVSPPQNTPCSSRKSKHCPQTFYVIEF